MFHGFRWLPFLTGLLGRLLFRGGGFLRGLRDFLGGSLLGGFLGGFLCGGLLLGGFLRRSLHSGFLRRGLHDGFLRRSRRGGLLCRRFPGRRFLGGRFGRRGFRFRFRNHRRNWSLYRTRKRYRG